MIDWAHVIMSCRPMLCNSAALMTMPAFVGAGGRQQAVTGDFRHIKLISGTMQDVGEVLKTKIKL